MRFVQKYILVLGVLILFVVPLFAKGDKIAVVDNRYDNIGRVLSLYHISYVKIPYSELSQKGALEGFDTVFFPSGMEPAMEDTIDVVSQGRSIRSVNMRIPAHKIDLKAIKSNIEEFILNGGGGYFSGYSYKLLNLIFHLFNFYDDFAYMGLEGRVWNKLHNELVGFSLLDKTPLYITYPGWVVVKGIHNGVVNSTAHIDTARGKREAIISSLFSRGRGLILYAAYYSTTFSDFRRYHIYRLINRKLLLRIRDMENMWGQDELISISDAIHRGEGVRKYRAKLKKGKNYIYFQSKSQPFMIEVLDDRGRLIKSNDSFDLTQKIYLYSKVDSKIFINIYPSNRNRWSGFCFTVANGGRYFPYLGFIVKFLIVIFSIVITVLGYFYFWG